MRAATSPRRSSRRSWYRGRSDSTPASSRSRSARRVGRRGRMVEPTVPLPSRSRASQTSWGSEVQDTVSGACPPSSRDRTATSETFRTEGPLKPRWVKRNPPVVRRPVPGASTVTGRETPAREACRGGDSVRGVSAGYSGWMVCPRASAIRSPEPSLPVAGTESPPVARIRAPARMAGSPPSGRTHHPPAGWGSTAPTGVEERNCTPRRRASSTSRSLTSRARFPSGKSFPVSGSSTRWSPSTSWKNCRCRSRGHDSRIFFSVLEDDAVTKSRGSSTEGRTLHRPPPEMRIFRPPSGVRSRRRTGAAPPAAWMAAINPAAPAPTTTMGSAGPSPGEGWVIPATVRAPPPGSPRRRPGAPPAGGSPR